MPRMQNLVLQVVDHYYPFGYLGSKQPFPLAQNSELQQATELLAIRSKTNKRPLNGDRKKMEKADESPSLGVFNFCTENQ